MSSYLRKYPSFFSKILIFFNKKFLWNIPPFLKNENFYVFLRLIWKICPILASSFNANHNVDFLRLLDYFWPKFGLSFDLYCSVWLSSPQKTFSSLLDREFLWIVISKRVPISMIKNNITGVNLSRLSEPKKITLPRSFRIFSTCSIMIFAPPDPNPTLHHFQHVTPIPACSNPCLRGRAFVYTFVVK